MKSVPPSDNITDDLFGNEEKWPDEAGIKRKANGTWTPVTWREFARQVRGVAAGFIAAGIQPGDRVALMSHTRFEWTVLDYAILTAGAITVPVYPTSSLEQVEWILGDSGAVAAIVETDEHAEKVASARAGLPALADQRGSFAYRTDLGSAQLMQFICPLIPRSAAAVGLEQPPVSKVPVLAFNGAYDPIEQSRNWAGAQQLFPDSRDITLPGQGHDTNDTWDVCAGPLTKAFIEQASVTHLDTNCLANIPAPVFDRTLP